MRIVFVLIASALVGFSSCSSCQRSREIKERKEALLKNMNDELEAAKRDLHTADSIASFLQFEVDDFQSTLVFEKNEEYQSKGFWVLPEHAGDKQALTFFPEVEEEGQMLLVKISADRKWSFLKIGRGEKNPLESKEVKAFLDRELTDEEKIGVMKCYKYSETFNKYNDARASMKKNKLKIEYYEKKTDIHTTSVD